MQNENEKKEDERKPELLIDLDHMTYDQMGHLAEMLRKTIKQFGAKECDTFVYLLGLVEYMSWKRFFREE